MYVRCIKAFGTSVPGDLALIPDGARMDPAYWEVVTPVPPPDPPKPAAPAAAFPAKEM